MIKLCARGFGIPIVTIFFACGASAQTGSTAPYSWDNPPPANWYPYSSPANLFNKPLPADKMSHLFQPQNYGISGYTGDQIAQAALTDDGTVAMNQQYSGGYADWHSPASDGTPGENDFDRPVYFSAITDPWWELWGESGAHVIMRIPTGAPFTHGGTPGTADDSFFGAWDQDLGIWLDIYSSTSQDFKWPAPSGGCGTSPTNPCKCTNFGVPGCGTGPYHSTSAAWFDPSVKDDFHQTGTYSATIKGIPETFGGACDNGGGGSPGGNCVTWFAQIQQGIPHSLLGGLQCTNSQGTHTVFPVTPSNTAYVCQPGQLPHNGANMPPNGALLTVDYTDAQIASMNLDTAQRNLLTVIAHYGTYLSVTSNYGGEGFGAVSEGTVSGLAYYWYKHAQAPFYFWLASQKLGPPTGGTAPQINVFGSTDNSPPISQYRLTVNAFYGLPLETCSGPGCMTTDLHGHSCSAAPGCDITGHVHIVDPCVPMGLAGVAGGCVTLPPAPAKPTGLKFK